MNAEATEGEIAEVVERAENLGLTAHRSDGTTHTVIGLIGDVSSVAEDRFLSLPGVERVVRVAAPYKLVSRDFHPQPTQIEVGDVCIGGRSLVMMAGPCSVESPRQLFETAEAVAAAGAHMLRGGAYKPRTSPYSFQGLAEEGLRLLAEARSRTGLPVVTEVMAPGEVELVSRHADVLQVGARNMQNFSLLKELGQLRKPVLLKRGLAATIEEWLLAAEYILAGGNSQVILCERGIRTFETATRNTLDLNAVALAKRLSHLPVIVDPSHATGRWDLVTPMALAAVAAGADGLIIEVHQDPAAALSDGAQSLRPERFGALVEQVARLAPILGREVRWPRRQESLADSDGPASSTAARVASGGGLG